MRNTVISIAVVAITCGAATAHASDLSVGVSIAGEVTPGVYGRVDIGNRPPPVLYAQPVIITKPVRTVAVEPVYMHVPPGHAKNWSKHCRKYDACTRPVYFVKSAEYEPGHQGGKAHKEHKKHKHDRD